jgi:hypothetical protein
METKDVVLERISSHINDINKFSNLSVKLFMFIDDEDTTRYSLGGYSDPVIIYDILRSFLEDKELAKKVFDKMHNNV